MLENIKTRKKNRLNYIEQSEDAEDILLAKKRLENPESIKNRIPFEKVLKKFNITQNEIDNAEEVEFV